MVVAVVEKVKVSWVGFGDRVDMCIMWKKLKLKRTKSLWCISNHRYLLSP